MTQELVKKNDGALTVGRTGETMAGYLEEHAQELLEVSSVRDLNMKKVANVCVELLSKENGRALAECSVVSFFNALKQCIGLGLEPTSSKQFGYFIPYKPEVQFKLSWMGILELARRAGVTARANCVYKDDKFRWVSGNEDAIEHEPNIFAQRDESTLVGVYCVADVPNPDGSKRRLVEVMSKAEVDEVRKCAAKGSTAWSGFYSEMAKKTVIRRASKSWPLAVDLHDAIARDAEGEFDFTNVRPEDAVDPAVRETVEADPEPGLAMTGVSSLADAPAPATAEGWEPKTARRGFAEVIDDTPTYAGEKLLEYHLGKIRGAKTLAELQAFGKAAGKINATEAQKLVINGAFVAKKTELLGK